MDAPIAHGRNVVRRFGTVVALGGVNVDIGRGECVALFGPNGAGKTTLLRMLATLVRPTSGTLQLFGGGERRAWTAARRRIGFLGHRSFLYPDLSPTENLRLYAELYGVAAPERRIAELIEQTGVEGWAHRPLRTLSRGLEQRCAVARALLHDPELLLLDEPFSGLDAAGVAMLTHSLQQTRSARRSIVVSTHDVALGLAVSTRAILLRRGRIAWDGPTADDVSRAAFTAAYDGVFAAAATRRHA